MSDSFFGKTMCLTRASVMRKVTGSWDFLDKLTTIPSSEETEDERTDRIGLEAM